MNEIILTEKNFDAEVIHSPIPVLADFYAEWCGPCRMLAPVLEEIALDYAGLIKIAKADTDRLPQLAARYEVYALPTVIAFVNGNRVGVSVGYQSRQRLLSMLEGYLSFKT